MCPHPVRRTARHTPSRKVRLAARIIRRHAALRERRAAPEIAVLSLAFQHDAAPAGRTWYPLASRDLRRPCRFAEITCECRLPREEFLRRPHAVRHRVQLILPDRRCIGIRHRIGQRVDKEICLRRRRQHLLLSRSMKEFAADEILDDARTRRLRPDAGHIAQHLFRRLVLDVLVNLLHPLEERRGRKPCGRLCLPLLHLCRDERRRVALFHRWEYRTLLVLLLRILGLILPRTVHRAPSRRAFRTSARRERLTVMRHFCLRLIVDIVRTELRNVGTRDQLVDIALHRREPREVHGHGCRDDRMMCRNLCVVPRTRLLRRICRLCPRRKRRIREGGEIAENLCRILVLTHGQILCIRARIAGQFFLVQLLCRIEHLLRFIAVAFACEHLQCRERKGQRRRLLLFLALILCHHAVCGRLAE